MRLNRLHFPSIIVVLLLSGCGDSIPQLKALSPDAVVLAFGDSLTHGSGAQPEESYPVLLATLIDHKVVNAGVPGEVSAAGLKRLPGVLDKHQPQLLILCHGGNDLLRRKDPAELKANLQAMIREARSRGIDVVLMAVPKPAIFLSSFDVYAEIAREMGVPVEADIMADVISNGRLKSDRVHPNAAGYRAIAEAVYGLLQQTGSVK